MLIYDSELEFLYQKSRKDEFVEMKLFRLKDEFYFGIRPEYPQEKFFIKNFLE